MLGKGSKLAVIPLPPRGPGRRPGRRERTSGPLLLGRNGDRLNRQAATRIVVRLAKQAGVSKHISPHSLRHSFITAALDAGVPLRDVQIAARHADPRTTFDNFCYPPAWLAGGKLIVIGALFEPTRLYTVRPAERVLQRVQFKRHAPMPLLDADLLPPR